MWCPLRVLFKATVARSVLQLELGLGLVLAPGPGQALRPVPEPVWDRVPVAVPGLEPVWDRVPERTRMQKRMRKRIRTLDSLAAHHWIPLTYTSSP